MDCTLARDTDGSWIYTQKFQKDEVDQLKQELSIMRQLCGTCMGRYWAIFYREVYGHRPIVSNVSEEWTVALVKEGLVLEADSPKKAQALIYNDLVNFAKRREAEEEVLRAEAMEQFEENHSV